MPVNIQTAIMRAPEIPLPFYRYLYRQVGARWQWVDRLRMNDEGTGRHALRQAQHDLRLRTGRRPVLRVSDRRRGYDRAQPFRADGACAGSRDRQVVPAAGALRDLDAEPLRVTTTTNNLDHPRALQLYQMFGFSPVSTGTAIVRPLSDKELLELAKRSRLARARIGWFPLLKAFMASSKGDLP